MTGLRRILFAALAAFLRFVAHLPLAIARGLDWLADRCEERAAPSRPRSSYRARDGP